jgi:hypothetical protein
MVSATRPTSNMPHAQKGCIAASVLVPGVHFVSIGREAPKSLTMQMLGLRRNRPK